MEVAGAVATITGILGFAGQAVKGLGALAEVIQDAKYAPEKITAAIRNCEDLLSALENITFVVKQLESPHPTTSTGITAHQRAQLDHPISLLHGAVKDCRDEVGKWSQKVLKVDVRDDSFFTGAYKRIKFAAIGKKDFNDLCRSLSSERQSLNLLLTTLSIQMEAIGMTSIRQVESQLNGLTKANLEINDTLIHESNKATAQGENWWNLTAGGLASVEACIKKVAEDQSDLISMTQKETQSHISSANESIATLATSVSMLHRQIAQLEKKHRSSSQVGSKRSAGAIKQQTSRHSIREPEKELRPIRRSKSQIIILHDEIQPPSPKAPLQHEGPFVKYCCDALSGIDDGFRIEDIPGLERRVQCLYCWQFFEDLDSRSLGKHLVEYHQFGQCDQGTGYADWSTFRAHLAEFHKGLYAKEEPPKNRKLFEINTRHDKYHVWNDNTRRPIPMDMPNCESLIESKLVALLANHNVYEQPNVPHRPRDRLELAKSLEKLEKATEDSSNDKTELLCSAACMEEELIVQCDEKLPFNWAYFNREYVTGFQHGQSTARSKFQDKGKKYWICVFKHSTRTKEAHLEGQCLRCSTGKIYSSWETALHHSKVHQGQETLESLASDLIEIVAYARPMSCVELLPYIYGEGTFQDRLNWWFSGVFIESDYIRTLLRSGVVFETGDRVSEHSYRLDSPQFAIQEEYGTTGWASRIDKALQPSDFPWINIDLDDCDSTSAADSREDGNAEDLFRLPTSDSDLGKWSEPTTTTNAILLEFRRKVPIPVHTKRRTNEFKWICVDLGKKNPSLSSPLSACSACVKRWQYDTRVAAEAHLRRAHMRNHPPTILEGKMARRIINSGVKSHMRNKELDPWIEKVRVAETDGRDNKGYGIIPGDRS